MTGNLLVALQLKDVISKATKLQVCSTLGGIIWQQHGAGTLSDRRADQLDQMLKLRQSLIQARIVSTFSDMRRKPQAPRKREASIARRRGMAAAGFLPPEIAVRFTISEQSVLSVLADLAGKSNVIRWAVDAIAGRAGVSRSMVQKTLRKAHDLGLIKRQLQARKGQKHDLSLIRILCTKWLGWLTKRIGWKKESPTNTQDLSTKVRTPASSCIATDSNPYQPRWKRLISPTSRGESGTRSPQQV
ncbi:hypothetical protein ACCS91_33465 [Rhizobium ruizarguesonis]|uniref:hypothetical protein n=1 Tax=Rhizobium ruizarguesonis TaxID=2081791 RepID=UPI00163B527A|nr:hypothetical protein [Rhizobium ruizarguesonis]MBC2806656.1 hypothetical protein [Rhizobium ruizarguesonis]